MTTGGSYFTPKIFSKETEEKRKKTREQNKSLQGENHPRAKLSDQEVLNIRYRYKEGESIKKIWEDYKKLYPNIVTFKRIVFGNSYKKVYNPIKQEDKRKLENSPLKEEIIDMRKKYYVDNMKILDIYNSYSGKYDKTVISNICRRKTYNNVKDNIPDLRKRKNYRLTNEEVIKIRFLYDNNIKTISQLSSEYNITINSVSRCVKRETYKNIK